MRSCLLVAGFVACAACARPASQAAGPNVVTITATDYAFSAPDTIPAGLTTLRLVNRGKELHHASLVRLGDGKTIADFQAGLQAAMQNHTPPPPWIAFAGGPNAVTRSEEHTSELQSPCNLVCRLLLEKKKKTPNPTPSPTPTPSRHLHLA